MTFRIEINGEYGDPDGSIHLMDDDAELVMWDSAEWLEDPSLVFVIANAIRMGYTYGPAAVRATIDGQEAPEEDQAAIVITRGQLAAMTGRELTPEFVERLDEIWPDSSIPETLATIGDSIGDECGAHPAWSDRDVADHVLGSGATSYSWWKFIRRLPDGTYHARLENPDHGEETVSTAFTANDVRRVRKEILGGQHRVSDTVRDALREDPDADAVDCLLQVLILGEITYA